jgi:methionyl-tRNA synthetase
LYQSSNGEFEAQLLQVNEDTVKKYEEAMDNMEFSVALTALWQLVSRTNKFIDETAPWALAKDEEKTEELASVMVHLAESLRRVAVMLQPFLTKTPKDIFKQLSIVENSLQSWESLERFGMIPEGTKVEKGEPIFPRLDIQEEVSFIKEKMQPTVKPVVEEPKVEEIPEVEEITIDDFMKVDLRVAQVVEAEPIKKADKLLKLQLDLGYERRQVVSGIAQFYKPEDLVGQRVICVTNLKPVKLRGELSQGMILAGQKDGIMSLATVSDSLPLGAKVK